MLKFDAPTNSRISDAIKAGVTIDACENAMRNQKLARADMHPNVSYVRAGVVQIVKRQREGWAYLRPQGPRTARREREVRCRALLRSSRPQGAPKGDVGAPAQMNSPPAE
jgi:hypothetical protein